jgi:hypothetical protein
MPARSFAVALRWQGQEAPMRSRFRRWAALPTALVSLASLFCPGAALATDDGLGLGAGTRLLQPIIYKQLTVFPVVRSAVAVDKTQYLTLTDGLKRKLVTVSEVGQGGSVNTLVVHNGGTLPLLILGGEVVLGGQQDRVLGQDTIVPAHEKLQVQVFCVEHGRWSGGREFSAAQGMADGKIRVRAKYKANQQEVWDEVAKKNAAHGVAPATGTYRNLAAGDDGKKTVAPYRAAVGDALGKLPDAKSLVGVVVAINGRVTNVELFARPELFAAYRDKLLDSIYMGAADVPVVDKAPPAKPADVAGFVKKAKVAAERKVSETKAGATVEQRGEGVMGSKVQAPAAASPVYESYQADE